ncbi:NADAR family protein [Phanerochaete sordida]|uniref:NADAR family protein n=1 Tax=Phanerochaete sordida TaxID=48140 RepID=A0A9P3GJ82_9APHY|nr:NADAR family protein [Phanerochaete sordida]
MRQSRRQSLTVTNLLGAAVEFTAMAAITAVVLPPAIAAASSGRAQRTVRWTEAPVMSCNRNEPYYELTNGAPYTATFEERVYPTAEHLFQSFRFYGTRPDLAERIRTATSPRAAREEAERQRRDQRHNWSKEQLEMMDCVLAHKFAQHAALANVLLGTGYRYLVLNSYDDAFWGCGPKGQGRNELGKALMRLRDKLRGSGQV